MRKKLIVTIIVTVVCTLLVATAAFAALGINIVDLLTTKVTAIAQGSTSTADTQLDQAEQAQVADLNDYLTDYITGITTELNNYAQTRIDAEKVPMEDEVQAVKDTLDANRATVVASGKAIIDNAVEGKGDIKINKLRTDLENLIKEALKP